MTWQGQARPRLAWPGKARLRHARPGQASPSQPWPGQALSGTHTFFFVGMLRQIEVEDITVALEDSLVTISTIAGSRFVGPIRAEVEEWQKSLLLFQEISDEYIHLSIYMYLCVSISMHT